MKLSDVYVFYFMKHSHTSCLSCFALSSSSHKSFMTRHVSVIVI